MHSRQEEFSTDLLVLSFLRYYGKIKAGLSAGRVQSVAVRFIVDREREIDKFKPTVSFKITALFDVEGKTLQAELPKKFQSKGEAEEFLKKCLEADFSIKSLETKPAKKSPAPPLQPQHCNRKPVGSYISLWPRQ